MKKDFMDIKKTFNLSRGFQDDPKSKILKQKSDFRFMDIKKMLEKQKYAVVGHSAVQVCQWTKNSLNNKGVCWKEKCFVASCPNRRESFILQPD